VSARVLVVDGDEQRRSLVAGALTRAGNMVAFVDRVDEARARWDVDVIACAAGPGCLGEALSLAAGDVDVIAYSGEFTADDVLVALRGGLADVAAGVRDLLDAVDRPRRRR